MNDKSDQDLFERVQTPEEKERARLYREAHPEPPKPSPSTTLTGSSKKSKQKKSSSKTGTRTKTSPGTDIEGVSTMNTNTTPKTRQGRSQDPSPNRVFTITSRRSCTACNSVGASVTFNDKDGDRYQTNGEFKVLLDGSGVEWVEFATEAVLTANEAAVEAAKAE